MEARRVIAGYISPLGTFRRRALWIGAFLAAILAICGAAEGSRGAGSAIAVCILPASVLLIGGLYLAGGLIKTKRSLDALSGSARLSAAGEALARELAKAGAEGRIPGTVITPDFLFLRAKGRAVDFDCLTDVAREEGLVILTTPHLGSVSLCMPENTAALLSRRLRERLGLAPEAGE